MIVLLAFFSLVSAYQNTLSDEDLANMLVAPVYPSSGNCGGTYVIEGVDSAVLHSNPSFPQYENNMACFWKITAAESNRIQVYFRNRNSGQDTL